MLEGKNNTLSLPWEIRLFSCKIVSLFQPSNMAAVKTFILFITPLNLTSWQIRACARERGDTHVLKSRLDHVLVAFQPWHFCRLESMQIISNNVFCSFVLNSTWQKWDVWNGPLANPTPIWKSRCLYFVMEFFWRNIWSVRFSLSSKLVLPIPHCVKSKLSDTRGPSSLFTSLWWLHEFVRIPRIVRENLHVQRKQRKSVLSLAIRENMTRVMWQNRCAKKSL